MDYGAWAPYLDEPDLLEWYELPDWQLAACEQFVPDGTELEPLSGEQFAALHEAAVDYANESVARFTVPYHGPEHFRLTEEQGLAAVAKLEELRDRRFPLAVVQNLSLALYLHDCHHCGCTFRADYPQPERLPWPDLPASTSAEWVSARSAARLAMAYGVPAPAQLFQTQVIWASTFGGQTPRGQQFGIPNLQPLGLWGRIMRAADVCPQADTTDWLKAGIAVNYGETPATPASGTWNGYVLAQLGFAKYIEHCFDKLDEVADTQLTDALGWRSRLRGHVARVEALAAGQAPELERVVRAELARYQVTLL